MPEYNATTLINLIHLGLEQDVRKVLENQLCDVNETDDMGNCPILAATASNRLEMVKLLMKFQVKVDVTDALGRTPIKWAQRNGNKEMETVLQAALHSSQQTQQHKTSSLHSPAV